MWAAVSGGTPTFYTRTTGGQIWKFVGTGTGSWTRVDNTDGLAGGASVFAVDEGNPNRLAMANNAGNIFFSTDGGVNWDPDAELDDLMIGSGAFRNRQPTLLAFDSEDPNFVIAGGTDSGVFLSTDGGANWGRITDPINSAASGIVHLPEPYHAYFDHEPAGSTEIYVGTRGRGVWRFNIRVPVANADGPYTTPEGTNVVLNGTGSTDPDNAPLTYEWDFDNDGQYDDATGATPTFDRVGQDGVYPVGLKVTAGGVVDTDSTTVTVTNVAPTVTIASDAPKPENQAVTVTGVISDPGWLDPLTATIDWGDGTGVQPLGGVVENTRPDATLTYSASHTYGDDGVFTATVCGFDDDTSTCSSLPLTITNVNPTATIDESGATLVNGVPTFLLRAGVPGTFTGRSTDPGSDDLLLSWDWGDGPPSPDVATTYLVNPPNPDPDPSPTVQPRDVTDQKTHTFGDACLYTITFSATDDDGGAASDSGVVIVTGTADKARPDGYWQHQFRRNGRTDFTDAQLQCYLAIINFASTIFSEVRDAGTIPAAFDVLSLAQNGGNERQKLDRALITAWLNFANGAIAYNQLIDGTPFSAVMAAAEMVRADPAATPAQLRAQRQIVGRIK